MTVATAAPELLRERATALLEATRGSGLRPTVPNLCSMAKKLFPELAGHRREKDLDALANAALRLDSGGSVEGDGRIPTGRDGTSAGDWPVRTVARRVAAEPEAAPAPAAAPPLAHANGTKPGGGKATVEFLRHWIPEHLDASEEQGWEAFVALGPVKVPRGSFRTYWSQARKALREEGKIHDVGRGGEKPVARHGAPRRKPRSCSPRSRRSCQVGRWRPRRTSTMACAATGIDMVGYENFRSVHVPAVRRSLGMDSPMHGGRKRKAGSERDQKLDRAAAKVGVMDPPAAPRIYLDPKGHEVSDVALPPIDADWNAKQLLGLNGPADTEAEVRPGLVEIHGGDDRFKAVRREDGDWDVELNVTVDPDTMDKLAGIIWEQAVMGARA